MKSNGLGLCQMGLAARPSLATLAAPRCFAPGALNEAWNCAELDGAGIPLKQSSVALQFHHLCNPFASRSLTWGLCHATRELDLKLSSPPPPPPCHSS